MSKMEDMGKLNQFRTVQDDYECIWIGQSFQRASYFYIFHCIGHCLPLVTMDLRKLSLAWIPAKYEWTSGLLGTLAGGDIIISVYVCMHVHVRVFFFSLVEIYVSECGLHALDFQLPATYLYLSWLILENFGWLES